jgi:CRISPR-associated endonuclease/helicase Cas3
MVEGVGSDASLMLAKSSHGAPTARNQVRVWPVGMRHEAVSLALVAEAPADAFAGVDRELVEHLVASHHGRARPLFPAVDEVSPRSVAVDFDGISFEASTAGSHPSWSQPSRFQRLCDRYGSWGLAYLEATLRIADISISKEGR